MPRLPATGQEAIDSPQAFDYNGCAGDGAMERLSCPELCPSKYPGTVTLATTFAQ